MVSFRSRMLLCLSVSTSLTSQSHAFVPSGLFPGNHEALRRMHGSSSTSSSSPSKPQIVPALYASAGDMSDVVNMSTKEILKELMQYGIAARGNVPRQQLIQALVQARNKSASDERRDSSRRSRQQLPDDGGEDDDGYINVEVITGDNGSSRYSYRRTGPASFSFSSSGDIGSPFDGLEEVFGGFSGGTGAMTLGDLLGRMGFGLGGFGGNPFENDELMDGRRGTNSPKSEEDNPFGIRYTNDSKDAAKSKTNDGAKSKIVDETPEEVTIDPEEAKARAQKMMQNPKVMELVMKAKGNSKVSSALRECMKNPAACAKYEKEPIVGDFISELKQHL